MILAILIDFLGSKGKRNQARFATMKDADLVDLYQSTQNLEVIGFLMERYQNLIVARTINYLKEEEQTLDFISDLYLKLSEKLKKPGDIQNFKGWLRRLITNTLIDQGRRQNRFDTYIHTLKEGVEEIDKKIALEIDSTTLSEALEQLKPLPRLYIIQHFFMGKQNKEISEEQGLAMNQVRGARNRALNKLSDLLGDSFSTYFQDS